ncbi:MAG: OmpA family protein [Chloroflexota bacterium]
MQHWTIKRSLFLLAVLAATFNLAHAQNDRKQVNEDSLRKELLEDAKVTAARKEIEITVRSVDISKFPQVKIIIEAYNKLGEPLDSLTSENLWVYENGVQKKVLEVRKIPVADQIAVDFVLLMDRTGSMQQNINAVRSNISTFSRNLMKRGIDSRLGLIIFGDEIDKVYQPTNNILTFLDWISPLQAQGGGDEKENALEALEALAKINWRREAIKVAVLITDAPYHQAGEEGFGLTNQTTNSIIELMQRNEIRVFCIVPPRLTGYQTIATKTRGSAFDIDYPFSTILDNFSNQLTNLFSLTYNSGQSALPDSIEIALFNKGQQRLVKKTIPIVELGRKLIIENLLFETNKFTLPDNVGELNLLADFLRAKSTVEILIEGHTDNVGSASVNLKLSELRAQAVKEYLVKKGIADARIQTKGFGKTKPIATNKTEFGRQLNRRTEIVILSK